MAQDPDKVLIDLTKAVEELTSMVGENNRKLDDAVRRQTESRKKSRSQEKMLLEANLLQNKITQQNTLRIGGLIRGMFSLHGMLQGVRDNNDRLSRALARTGDLTFTNYNNTLKVFRGANVNMNQAVQAIEEMVSEGMGRFGNETKLLAGQTKVLGINTKGLLQGVRFNTQALGFSEEQSITLGKTLINTALKFGSSIDGLIGAINTMKESLINTTAELGPGMAQSVQQAAIMLGGSTTEAQAMVTDFITSITSGPEAFLKAARLGVTFTPGMTGAQVAQATMQALAAAQAMAPTAGAGSQFALAALEQRNVLARKDLVLAQMLSDRMGTLTQTSLEEQVANIGRFSFEQAWQNAIFRVQELALGATVSIANVIARFGPVIPLIAVIATGVGVMAAGMRTLLGIIGMGGAGSLIRGGALSKLGNKFSLFPRALAGATAVVHGRLFKSNAMAFGREQQLLGTKLLARGFAPLQAILTFMAKKSSGAGTAESAGAGIGAALGTIALPAIMAALTSTGVGIPAAIALGIIGGFGGEKIGGLLGKAFDQTAAGGGTDINALIAEHLKKITAGQDSITDFTSQQFEMMQAGENTRRAQLEQLEDMNRMMRGSLEGNATDSPLSRLADDIARQVQGINQLVDLATEGNDDRAESLNTLRNNIDGFRGSIGIIQPGG